MDVGLALTTKSSVPVMNEGLQPIELYKLIGEVLMRIGVPDEVIAGNGKGKIVHRH